MQQISSIEDLGSLVRSERKKQCLTQNDLAISCNVGLSFIVNLEHGKTTSEIGKTLHVLTMLGIDLFAKKRGE